MQTFMRKGWTFIIRSTVIAASCAAVAYAQAPKTESASAGSKVTVTGCVERADQLNGTGTTSQSLDTDSQSFMLIRAAHETEKSGAAGKTGKSSTMPSMANGNRYRLDGMKSTLSPHVGHEVEINGTMSAPASSSASGIDKTSPAGVPTLKIDTIKMIAETCAR
jgi:siroheme synthase